MKKEQARAYIEVLDNLKRDLVDNNNSVVGEILDKIEDYATSVYVGERDELIVIPRSAIAKLRKEYCPKDCRNCRRFIGCEFGKMAFHKASGIECDEFEEANG